MAEYINQIKMGDKVYIIAGSGGSGEESGSGTVSFENILGEPEDNSLLKQSLDEKSDIGHTHDEYLSINGGDINGVISINSQDSRSIILKSSGDVSVAPEEDSYCGLLSVVDKNGVEIGSIFARHNSDGSIEWINQTRRVIGNNEEDEIFNSLELLIDSDGNCAVTVQDQKAWRIGLGAGSNGAWPISLGGTGAVDKNSAWTALGGGDIGKKDSLAASDIPNISTAKITSGTLAIARGGTGASTVNPNKIFAGPASGENNAAPSFRKLVAADIPSIDTSKITSGTLPIARGGTGNATGAASSAAKLTTERQMSVDLSLEFDSNNPVTFNGSKNVTLPIKNSLGTSHGGTGGTDSGWNNIQNASTFTGTIYYRKIGKFCYITSSELKLISGLNNQGTSAQTSLALCSLPSSYRPQYVTVLNLFTTTRKTNFARIGTAGSITVFSGTENYWSNTDSFYISGSYLTA